MSPLELVWKALWVHRDDRYGIQAQKNHVHEVFIGEAGAAQMGMQKPYPAESAAAFPQTVQGRNENASLIAHDYHEDMSAAVYDQADLSFCLVGEVGKFPGLFRGKPGSRRELAEIKPGQGLKLLRLKAGEVSKGFLSYK